MDNTENQKNIYFSICKCLFAQVYRIVFEVGRIFQTLRHALLFFPSGSKWRGRQAELYPRDVGRASRMDRVSGR